MTVRTRTREGIISSDSNVVRVPRSISANSINQNYSSLTQSVDTLMNNLNCGVNGTAALGTSSLTNSLIGLIKTF